MHTYKVLFVKVHFWFWFFTCKPLVSDLSLVAKEYSNKNFGKQIKMDPPKLTQIENILVIFYKKIGGLKFKKYCLIFNYVLFFGYMAMYNKVFKFNNSGTSDNANENVSKLKIFKPVFCKRMESFAPVFC